MNKMKRCIMLGLAYTLINTAFFFVLGFSVSVFTSSDFLFFLFNPGTALFITATALSVSVQEWHDGGERRRNRERKIAGRSLGIHLLRASRLCLIVLAFGIAAVYLIGYLLSRSYPPLLAPQSYSPTHDPIMWTAFVVGFFEVLLICWIEWIWAKRRARCPKG